MNTKLTYVTYKKNGFWAPNQWVFSMQLCLIYLLWTVKLKKEQTWVPYYRKSLLTKVREGKLDLLLDEYVLEADRKELIQRILRNFYRLIKDDPKVFDVKMIDKMYASIQKSSRISRLLKRKQKLPYNIKPITAIDPDDPFSFELRHTDGAYFQKLLSLIEERTHTPKLRFSKKTIIAHNIHSSMFFSEAYEHIQLIKTVSNKYGVMIAGNLKIAAVYDQIYPYTSLKMMMAHIKQPDESFSEYHFFDLGGNLIKRTTDFKSISKNGSVDQDMELFFTVKLKNISKPEFEYKNQLIGVWDENFNELIPCIYDHLSYLNKEKFAVAKEGKWGVINATNETVLNFEYDEIIGRFTEEMVLAKQEGYYFKVDVSGNIVGKADFSHILNLSRERNVPPGKHARNYYRIIKGGKLNKEDGGFTLDLDILKFDGAWGLLDEKFNEVIPPQYRYIKFFENRDFLMAVNGSLSWKIEESDYEDEYTAINNIQCGIIDIQNNSIVPIEYTWIEEVYSRHGMEDEYHWIIYKGGTVNYYHEDRDWTVDNGKSGVINNRCEVIVPAIYDTILNDQSVGRKPYYFAQNGKHFFDQNLPYHVYTLKGERLTTNVPHPYKN